MYFGSKHEWFIVRVSFYYQIILSMNIFFSGQVMHMSPRYKKKSFFFVHFKSAVNLLY